MVLRTVNINNYNWVNKDVTGFLLAPGPGITVILISNNLFRVLLIGLILYVIHYVLKPETRFRLTWLESMLTPPAYLRGVESLLRSKYTFRFSKTNPAVYRTWRITVVLKRAHHSFLSWARWIHTSSTCTAWLRYVLSSNLHTIVPVITLELTKHIPWNTNLSKVIFFKPLVEALFCKPEGRGFDSPWGHWIFNWPNPSSRTMALGSTQPPTEISITNLPGGKGRPASGADNLTAICEPTV
jgi:hypothetical protein